MMTSPRPQDAAVFVEQIKLLLGNVGSSVLPAYLLALLMTVSLTHDANKFQMVIWCTLVMASKTLDYVHAQFYLKGRLTTANTRAVHLQLLGLNALDAIAWSSLALIVLADADMVEFMLVNSVLAGIAGSSMSLLSPVLSVFVTFVAVEFLIVAYEFWHLGNADYMILSMALILYFCSLTLQARNSCLAALTAIKLRFENTQLVSMLQEETAKAVEAHQEAVEANLAKSRFLAAASHDLRQPLHALGLFLGVLGSSKLDHEQRQVLANAQSVTQASSEMLNTLLDFSRIDAGVIETRPAAFRVQELFFKLKQEFAPQANAKELVWRCRESQAVLWSDPKLVELIIRNLVSNAIRYTDQGGILMACRSQGTQCSVEVWDTGIGIPASKYQDIFKEFYQLGNSERDRRKGLGLGLAIANGLATTLGLSLSVSSIPGRGSVFRVLIPFSNQANVTATSPQNSPSPEGDLSGFKVLVLDDDAAVREGMRQLLHHFGCQSMAVETVEEALACVGRWRPDLLISDYRLRNNSDGLQAIASIRQASHIELPALLITGDTAPERLREAHKSGVQLLHKPVAPDELRHALLQSLQQHPSCTQVL